ncbi:ABC transporter substrate-binding protein [Rhodoferax sp.]|uniref:ABC transporter substrate-binding protein n=1 Tax=Rhodoferax sp. TaxID=50421 RepID=UPI00374DFA55
MQCFKSSFSVLVLATASFCGVAGLSSASAQEAVFAINAREIGSPSYNPLKETKLNVASNLIFDRLVIQDADQSFHGQLATSWESSADGMTWTFKLRKGVKFHDGEPFNAKTIEWWIPKFKGRENAFMVEAIDKVVVVDDYTVKFLMKNPDPSLLLNMTTSFMGIPSPKAYDALGDKFGITAAVGSGPFKLESFTVGQQTKLVRNEDYRWASDLSKNAGPAKIKRLTLREIGEDSTAFLELKTGGVDMLLSVPTDFLPKLQAEKSMKVVVLPGTEVFYMPINTAVEPLTDIRVREAVAVAVNQKEIMTSLFGGVGAVANNFLVSSLQESKVAPKFNISYNPARSAKLLDEAGWVVGAGGMRAKAGTPLTLKLWTQNGTQFKRVTEVVQAQLKAVGVNAEITVQDPASINAMYKKKTEHQLAVRSYDYTNADILDWFFSGTRLGYPNVSMWNDQKSEELNAKAMKGSRTWDERVANFKAYHEYLLSQFVFAPIYQPPQSFAYSQTRLKLPDTIRGIKLATQSIMDIEVK